MPIPPATVDPREPSTSLPDGLQFVQLLSAIVHGAERTSKRMTGNLAVTGPQRLALRVVGLFPGMSAGNLAVILHVHPSTPTGVLQRLVFRLTARGARVNATTQGTIEAAVGKARDGVTEGDHAATRRVLERLAECLEPPSATVESDSPRKGQTHRPQSRGHR